MRQRAARKRHERHEPAVECCQTAPAAACAHDPHTCQSWPPKAIPEARVQDELTEASKFIREAHVACTAPRKRVDRGRVRWRRRRAHAPSSVGMWGGAASPTHSRSVPAYTSGRPSADSSARHRRPAAQTCTRAEVAGSVCCTRAPTPCGIRALPGWAGTPHVRDAEEKTRDEASAMSARRSAEDDLVHLNHVADGWR